MSYDGKLMRRAMVRFEEAKQRRADALHARERAVYAVVPRIAEIDAALRETMSKLISSQKDNIANACFNFINNASKNQENNYIFLNFP